MRKNALLRALMLLGLFTTFATPTLAQSEAKPVTGKAVQWPDGSVTISVDIPAPTQQAAANTKLDPRRTINTIATFPVVYREKPGAERAAIPLNERPDSKIIGDATLVVSVFRDNKKAAKSSEIPQYFLDLRYICVDDDGEIREIEHERRSVDDLPTLTDLDKYELDALAPANGKGGFYKILPGKVYDYAVVFDELPALVHSFEALSKQFATSGVANAEDEDDEEPKFVNGRLITPVPKSFTPSTPTKLSGSRAVTGAKSTPGTDVNVKGYYRKDGTYVKPHTRSKAGSKKP